MNAEGENNMQKRLMYALRSINYYSVLKIIVILNVLDLAFTLSGLSMGYISEGNALMGYILDKSVFAFIIAKLAVVFLFYFVCDKNLHRVSEHIKRLLLIPLFLYGFILVLHIAYFFIAVFIL